MCAEDVGKIMKMCPKKKGNKTSPAPCRIFRTINEDEDIMDWVKPKILESSFLQFDISTFPTPSSLSEINFHMVMNIYYFTYNLNGNPIPVLHMYGKEKNYFVSWKKKENKGNGISLHISILHVIWTEDKRSCTLKKVKESRWKFLFSKHICYLSITWLIKRKALDMENRVVKVVPNREEENISIFNIYPLKHLH